MYGVASWSIVHVKASYLLVALIPRDELPTQKSHSCNGEKSSHKQTTCK